MQVREGDEKGFVIGGDGEDGVPDLLDVDGAREGGFLCIVALQLYAMGGVGDVVCCDWGMVATQSTALVLILVLYLDI